MLIIVLIILKNILDWYTIQNKTKTYKNNYDIKF